MVSLIGWEWVVLGAKHCKYGVWVCMGTVGTAWIPARNVDRRFAVYELMDMNMSDLVFYLVFTSLKNSMLVEQLTTHITYFYRCHTIRNISQKSTYLLVFSTWLPVSLKISLNIWRWSPEP